jgi:hypothetical protein
MAKLVAKSSQVLVAMAQESLIQNMKQRKHLQVHCGEAVTGRGGP